MSEESCDKCRADIFPDKHRYLKITAEFFVHERCFMNGVDDAMFRGGKVIKIDKIFDPGIKSQQRKPFVEQGEFYER